MGANRPDYVVRFVDLRKDIHPLSIKEPSENIRGVRVCGLRSNVV